MKLTFQIKHCYNNKFSVTYSVPTLGGKNLDMVSNFTFSGFALADLLKQAKSVIGCRLYNMRKQGVPVPPANNILTVWDANLSDLPDSYKTQHKHMSTMFSAPSALRDASPVEEPEPEIVEDALYEILQVKGVWTIFKHEFPLLTWNKACELLKQKVENNE